MAPSPDFMESLRLVRERCIKVQAAANRNGLKHFDIDKSKIDEMVKFVTNIIQRDYDNLSDMPAYGRWRHFDIGDRPRLDNLCRIWETLGYDKLEQTRSLIDILVIAVLMDIKPCQTWTYTESTGKVFKRKDGIAVALSELFKNGLFSSDPAKPHRVDSEALIGLSLQSLRDGLQFTETNSFVGIEERLEVLNHLGVVLKDRKDYFGNIIHRPGNLMDYLLGHKSTVNTRKGPVINIETLWPVVLQMGELWASEDDIGGTRGLGDVWPCLAISNNNKDNLVSFHKLSQWLVYSMIEPMEKLLNVTILGTNLLTPLPDYCNGGFLIDSGFLTLKQADYERGIKNYHANSLLPYQPKVEVAPMFDMSDPVVTEWRALTVAYVDDITNKVRNSLGSKLSSSQLVQCGTWSAGREMAEITRPNTHEPPIVIKIDKRVIY